MTNVETIVAHPTDTRQPSGSWTPRVCRAIDAERRRQRLTRATFAQLMGVKPYRADVICTGTRGRVTVVDLARASNVLGVSLTELIREASNADTVNHFVSKAQVTHSVVFGVAVRALCGDRFVVEPEDGEVSDESAEVCKLCSIVYAGLDR